MKYTIIEKRISYRELPPRMIEVREDNSPVGRLNRYLKQMDEMIEGPKEAAGQRSGSGNAPDIVSLIFDQQARTKEQNSRHQAALIQERCDLARKHLDDINFRIYDLWEQKPCKPQGMGWQPDGKLNDIEKSIANLEKEKRETETALWRDVNELRTNVLNERQEYKATTRRMSILTGDRPAGGYDHAP